MGRVEDCMERIRVMRGTGGMITEGTLRLLAITCDLSEAEQAQVVHRLTEQHVPVLKEEAYAEKPPSERKNTSESDSSELWQPYETMSLEERVKAVLQKLLGDAGPEKRQEIRTSVLLVRELVAEWAADNPQYIAYLQSPDNLKGSSYKTGATAVFVGVTHAPGSNRCGVRYDHQLEIGERKVRAVFREEELVELLLACSQGALSPFREEFLTVVMVLCRRLPTTRPVARPPRKLPEFLD